jgi:type I restriction enzyme M protein
LIELDLLECVLGLGPNLFYNSPMEACVVVCRTQKPADRKRKVLFIDAVHEVARERAQSFLKAEHQLHILSAYKAFSDIPGFAKVATIEEILDKDANLSIPRYVRPAVNGDGGGQDLKHAWAAFEIGGREFWEQMEELEDMLDGVVAEEVPHD